MSYQMHVTKNPNGTFPVCDDRTPGADQTYPKGTVVTWDTSSQELDAKATDPTTDILGVSQEGVVAGVAQNPSGKVSVALADRTNVFAAKLTNGSGVVATPDAANVNVVYALLKNGTGMTQWWSVNEADSSGGVAEVIGYDTERDIVFFKFTEASLQQP
jgi:hypothetical protein